MKEVELMTNIKICVSHRIDLDSTVIKNDIFLPVYCGATYKKDKWNKDIIGDNTGNNISEKRMSFCELTVQYWAWKNLEADYYGLCHYRRYFSFLNESIETDIYGNINEKYLNEKRIEKYDLNNIKAIKKFVEQYDILVTEPFETKKVNIKNIKEQYIAQPYLYKKDLDILIEVIDNLYPDYSKFAKSYLESDKFIPCCLYIMKKDLFKEYSEWLFNILFEVEKRIDVKNYSIDSLRTIGHLGERLLGIFVLYQSNKRKKVKYLQRIIFWNTEKQEELLPIKKEAIPIVLSSSDYYVPYLYVTIKSFLERKKVEDYYDIIILNVNIEEKNKTILKELENEYENIKIRFYNIENIIGDYKFKANNHVSVETFYRLFIPRIFKYYEKVIFLDSDLIIKVDIKTILEEYDGKHVIYATRDADYMSQYCASEKVKEYTNNILELKDVRNYFQAGIIVFNVKLFNEKYSIKELLDLASSREYMYVDQDVLNKYLKNDIYYLNMRWNVMTDCAGMRKNNIKMFSPYDIFNEYILARKKPNIIHYAGFAKPWNRPNDDYAEDFWKIARKTIFYEIILKRMMENTVNDYLIQHNIFYHNGIISKNKKQKIKNFIKRFLPKGTRRHRFVKKLYFKLRGWPFVE